MINPVRLMWSWACRLGRRVRTVAARRYWTDERIHRSGMKLIDRICERRPTGSTVVFAGPNMGDVLYMMAFVEEYRRQNPGKRIIVATIKSYARAYLPRYGGYDEVAIISHHAWTRFAKLGSDFEVSRYGYSRDVKFMQVLRGFSEEYVSVMSRLRNIVFGVGDGAPIRYHQTPPPPGVTAIENFDEVCARVVVINPYSRSMHFRKSDFPLLSSLAEKLSRRGYLVYTNTVGDQLPVKGTKELRCSLPELYAIAGKIPLVVSTRSGVLDYIVGSGVNIYAVYFGGDLNIDAFCLRDWECSGLIREVNSEEFLADTEHKGVLGFLDEINRAKGPAGGGQAAPSPAREA